MITARAIVVAFLFVALTTSAAARRRCRGSAMYKVTFSNFLSGTGRFRNIVPKGGLVFSPMTGVTHSPRVSLFRRGRPVSKAVEQVCENGRNTRLLRRARALRFIRRVTSVAYTTGPVRPGKVGYIKVRATCRNRYLSVITMIAPSPDWVVQINNMPLWRGGKFIRAARGRLVAYDCGTDSGREFTDPSNLSLDVPTRPRGVFRRLSQDPTDRFMGRPVGYYKVTRIQ